MRDFSVELIWAKIQAACAVIGGWLGFFLGGMDGMLIALIVFMALDYVTGVMPQNLTCGSCWKNTSLWPASLKK